ncbi:unnamed protein product [Symbiodinium pilosum]|uniref:TRP C-terminal domain-containing protein n=1 Tax=Symbiodinium pilosum TaxID=2952 RepID=A0A812XR63_SYMPI|nr:unnamed protein product [Symbiodinium pilosum]
MATTEKKQTAVLLNQLMAFATVSNIVSSGLFQTSSYQSLQSDARMFLASASGVADFAQGSAGGAMSKDCLLSQLGLSGSLWATHLASTIIPVLLMMGLALTRNPGLSLVVGTNVFLPGFTAAFGKYLIAFRLKPEEQNGQVLMPFRLGIGLDSDLVIVPVIISLCFVVGVLGWLQAAHVKADSNGKVPNYVLYLTQSYKPECSVWEIERLVRKMLLSLTTQVLPVTYSPASQMQLVSVILLAALLLHFRYKPYKNESWNTIEVALLATGLLLSGVTTTLIANDLHWARTARTGIVLMMFVFLLVTVICGTMIVLVMLNMYWERQAARSVDSGDAERQGGKELPHDEVRAEAAEMEQ